MHEVNVVDHTGNYRCEFLIKNSGDFYVLGEPLLRDQYSVYDLDDYKMALGKVIDFDAPPPSPEDESNGAENGGGASDIDPA